MLNPLKHQPQHVRKAVEEINLPLQVRDRVNKGVEWLEEHAPPDWRLQMMHIVNGRVSSCVRFAGTTETPLALAFRRCPELRAHDDRVLEADVMHTYGLSRVDLPRFGFNYTAHTVGTAVIPSVLDEVYLEAAWNEALGQFHHRENVAPYRQPWHDHPVTCCV